MNVQEDRLYVVARRVAGYVDAPSGSRRTVTPREVADRCNITIEEAIVALERLGYRLEQPR